MRFILLPLILLVSCSDDPPPPFPTLPADLTPISVKGYMHNWVMAEDLGCFGTLSDGQQSIEIWAAKDDCKWHFFADGDVVAVDLIFNPSD